MVQMIKLNKIIRVPEEEVGVYEKNGYKKFMAKDKGNAKADKNTALDKEKLSGEQV
jgi:hypothetical protein